MSEEAGTRKPVRRTLLWFAVAPVLLGAAVFFITRSYTPPIKDREGSVTDTVNR
jgi:hypothetical protein